MNTNLDLQRMGLTPMTNAEMLGIDGGSIFTKIGDAIASAATAVGDYASCLWDNLTITVCGVTIKQGCACDC